MNVPLDSAAPQDRLVCVSGTVPLNQPLVSLENWAPNREEGLLLPVDAEPDERFTDAELIAIDFPAFSDGRGLSLAVLLRTRLGFVGEVRAVGEINADLLHYLVRCGFDSFELTNPTVHADGSNAATGFNTLAPYGDNYQASVLEREPAYRRVRRST